ncbi:hypothetical protein CBR_g39810 [Chara braunii]|uniref:STAS domain-containing protein n=1 Tax=Chara braunii TaxID=69332 RepID=A0A388LSD9_CHABU|nr:hypothetical protein CBR_g39810 [Chara braunii]|eukprot:GBG85244.1 hypothetical protein CBR_g39810 [Chara braunii]
MGAPELQHQSLAVEVGAWLPSASLCEPQLRYHQRQQIPNTKIFRNVLQYPNATMTPGVLLVRVDSSLYFFNCQYIVERVRELIVESLEQAKKTDNEQAPVEFVVLEMSPVVDIDVTGIVALNDLKATLKHWNIQLALANPNHTVLGKLNQSKFIEKLGTEWLFVSASEAERTVSRLRKAPSAPKAPTSVRKVSNTA